MGENRSLDEFRAVEDSVTPDDVDDTDDVDDKVDDERDLDETGDEREEGGGHTRGNREDVEPARATYRWDPEGGNCGVCGATVDRRWWDDSAGGAGDGTGGDAAGGTGDGRAEVTREASGGAFVCGDCKQW